jgi:hypothetical protein
MTPTARRTDNRAQRINACYESFRSAIMELWIRAKRERMTFDAMLAYRNEWIIGTPAYQAQPLWVKHKLDGVWDVLFALAYRQDLVFCYPHPHGGGIIEAKTLCDMGLAQELADKGLDKQGHHYWKEGLALFS